MTMCQITKSKWLMVVMTTCADLTKPLDEVNNDDSI